MGSLLVRPSGALEVVDVGVDDGGLADDGDGLAGAVETGVVGGLDVVDDVDVGGREVVVAGLAGGEVGIGSRRCCLDTHVRAGTEARRGR